MRRLPEEFQTSERRVCGLMEIPRMSYRYRSRSDDSGLRERLLALARENPRYGYRRLQVLLGRDRNTHERINHKRVWRVYRDLGLSVKRTRRKRLATRAAAAADADRAQSGMGHRLRQRRCRERAQAADLQRGGLLHAGVFDSGGGYFHAQPPRDHGVGTDRSRRVAAPVAIRSDNGPEMSSRHYLAWCIEKRDRCDSHSAGQAHAERARGELPRQASRRMLERELVLEPVRRAA